MTPVAPMSLIHEDTMPLTAMERGKRRRVTVMVRVWARRGEPPVVLVSEIQGEGRPDQVSCKVCDRAWRDICHYNTLGIRYYEEQDGNLWEVTFTGVGCPGRQHMTRPEYAYRMHSRFDKLIGRHYFGDQRDLGLAA